jgi:hypothetical protein
LITLQRDDIGPMSQTASPIRLMASLALVAALGLGLGACSHNAGGDFSKPTAAATNTPMDLASPVPGTPAPETKVQAATAPAEANPVNVGTIDAAAGPQPAAVKPKKPAKVATEPSPPEPAVAPAAFASDAKGDAGAPEKVPPVVVKTVRDDGFPNINAPPPEPAGKLLTPEERARVISELEALKNRQGVAPQRPAKKCTDQQIADGVKGCPAPSN